MARDGSTGAYSLPEAAFVYDTVISETAVNSNFSDLASEITNSLAADGQTPPTANLKMATFRHTGVGNAQARTDYAAAGQVQDGSFVWCGTAGGTTNALTLTPTPAITAYATGQNFRFKMRAAATDDAVTVAISGLATKAVEINDAALSASLTLEADKYYEILYDGTAFQAQRASADFLTSAAIGSTVQADVVTTRGDIVRGSSSGAAERLALGANGYALLSDGTDVAWGEVASATDLRMVALLAAAANGALGDLDEGVVDSFADATGVDAAASTNEIRFSAGYYKGLTASGGNSLQDSKTGSNSTLLDATRPHGGIRWTQSGAAIVLGVRADFHAVGTPGNVSARLYVADSSTIVAQSADVAVSTTGEIDFVFTSPYTLSDSVDYVIALRRDTGSYTLSTVTAPGTGVTYSALSTTEIHSISADSNMDGSEDLRMGVMLGNVANLTLTAESFTADATPTGAVLLVQVKENESITVNTDLIGAVSRDNGSTFETGVLALVQTLADGTKAYEAPGIDLSGQPSGTDVVWRVTTANTKDIDVYGVVCKVS